MSIFPQLDIQNHPDLEEKGYWFVHGYHNRADSMFISQPLNRKGQIINIIEHLYFLALFIFIGYWIFADLNNSGPDMNFAQVLLIALLIPVLVQLLFLGRKTYSPGEARFRAKLTGKKEHFYNSDENLYTTDTEGIYVCGTCETPIGSTDDKEKVSGHTICLKNLMFEIQGKTVHCPNCQAELGQRSDFSNLYELNGETLLLDAGGLHHIYPNKY